MDCLIKDCKKPATVFKMVETPKGAARNVKMCSTHAREDQKLVGKILYDGQTISKVY